MSASSGQKWLRVGNLKFKGTCQTLIFLCFFLRSWEVFHEILFIASGLDTKPRPIALSSENKCRASGIQLALAHTV
jgi:hypothetical protein